MLSSRERVEDKVTEQKVLVLVCLFFFHKRALSSTDHRGPKARRDGVVSLVVIKERNKEC